MVGAAAPQEPPFAIWFLPRGAPGAAAAPAADADRPVLAAVRGSALELTLTPAYGKDPILVGLVESQDLVARRDREGRIPRDLQGTWDWTVRHGKVSTGGWNPYLKEALQTMFETGLPAIVYEETTGEAYHPVDGTRHVR